MDFISGEKIQLIAEAFIGSTSDFLSNPYIIANSNGKQIIDWMQNGINEKMYNNPKLIYCHGHNMSILSMYINLLNNPFILITHNSDCNIIDNNISRKILNCRKLVKWYGQNVGHHHNKLHFLPIGIANRMWSHGNPTIFENIKDIVKTRDVFMNFLVDTNYAKRIICREIMISKNVPFLPRVKCYENIEIMKSYRFCICPEGNGFDTHRLWEAFYVKCVPILLRSTFSEIIKKNTGLPMILLNSWDEFDINKLPNYNQFDFTNLQFLSSEFYKNKILTTI